MNGNIEQQYQKSWKQTANCDSEQFEEPERHQIPDPEALHPHKSDVCDKAFRCQTELARHNQIHTGGKPLKCGECGKEFDQSSNLATHVRLVHQKLTLFECAFCGKQFGENSVLQVHERTHTEQPFACELCNYRSDWKRHLTQHLRHVHNQVQSYDAREKICRSASALAKRSGPHIDEKPFETTNCDMQCNYSNSSSLDQVPTKGLQIYERTDIGEKTFSCELICGDCGKEFSCKSNLSTHVRLVHQKLKHFECGFCGKQFGQKSNLQVHERTHSGEKPFACELCSYRSNYKSHLKRHMRNVHDQLLRYKRDVSETTQTVDQTFSCELCDHKSKSKNLLNEHVWKEHDEKLMRPCKCDDCGKTFISDYDLMLHRRTHTGEKPHKCLDCGKKFGQSGNLLTHVRMVHQKLRQFKCRFCGKQFGWKSVLQGHERTHTEQRFRCRMELTSRSRTHIDDKHLECGQCDYKCVKAHQLNKHVRNHHKNDRFDNNVCSISAEKSSTKNELLKQKRKHTESDESDHQTNEVSFGIEQFVEWDSEEEEENDGEDEQMMNVNQIKVEQETDF